eukprot:m.86003 g.86003  ORF g.86003 m.86003 type:complete len:817 (-) comp13037_c0_seq1:139-2589(-)
MTANMADPDPDEDDLLAELEAELEAEADKGKQRSPDAPEDEESGSSRKKTIEMSAEQLQRLQDELSALREFKASQPATQAQTTSNPSSKGKDFLSGVKLFKRSKEKQAKANDKSAADDLAKSQLIEKVATLVNENSALRTEKENYKATITKLQAELALHKETKDALSQSLHTLEVDMADQKEIFQCSMQSLSEKNTELTAKLNSLQNVGTETNQETESEAPPKPQAPSIDVDEKQYVCYSPLCQHRPTVRIQTTDNSFIQELHTVKGERDMVQKKLARSAEELQNLKSDIEGMRAQLRIAVDEASQSQALQDELKEKLEAAVEDVSKKQTLLVENSHLLDRFKEDLKLAREDEQRVLGKNSYLERRVSELGDMYKWSEKRALELEKDKEDQKKGFESQISEIEAARKKEISLNIQLTSANADLNAQVGSLKTKAKSDSTANDTCKADLARTRTELDEKERLLTEADSKMDAMREEIDALHDKISNLNVQVQLNERFKADLEDEISGREALEKESAMMAEASRRAAESEQKTASLLEEAMESKEKLSAEVIELRGKLEILNSDALKTGEVLEEKENLLQKQSDELNDLNSLKASLTEKLDNLEKEMASTESKLQEQLTDAEKDLSAANETITQLEQALTDSAEQRKLDQKKHTNSLKDLKRQLQKGGKEGSFTRTHSDGVSVGSRDSQQDIQPQQKIQLPGLQQQCASCTKLRDRNRFLDSHVAELTSDLQNKRKLIQGFLLREEQGRLAPKSTLPQNTKKSGMFRMGNAEAELTLAHEINSKLQQVTEDALLKNIQLQESLDTFAKLLAESKGGKK